MKYNKKYLYNAYNATSTDDGKGDLETYENWLERQLISRMKKIDELEKILSSNERESDRKHEGKEEFCPECGSCFCGFTGHGTTWRCDTCGYIWAK